MPAASNLVIADAQATPVNHTFVPIGPDPKDMGFWFEDQSAASPIGYWRVKLTLKRPPAPQPGQSSATRSYRVIAELHMPTLENVSNSTVSGVSPAPTISYTLRSFCEYVIPERSSLQNRKDLRKMTGTLNSTVTLTGNLVEDLQSIW